MKRVVWAGMAIAFGFAAVALAVYRPDRARPTSSTPSTPRVGPRSALRPLSSSARAVARGQSGVAPPSARPTASVFIPRAGCPVYSYARGLSRGRRLAREKRYADAARAYDEAVRARPYDAQARAERAYVEFLAGDGFLDEFELARALATTPELRAKIAYNEGLLLESTGQQDAARRAFVRAERLGSKQATRRLGHASRCTVTVASGAPKLDLETSWLQIYDGLSGGECPGKAPDPRSEADARAYVCGGCGGGGPWHRGVCSGPGPWRMSYGSMDCFTVTRMIQELGPGLLYVANGDPTDPDAPYGLRPDGNDWVLVTPNRWAGPIKGYFSDEPDTEYEPVKGWSDPRRPPRFCPQDERTAARLDYEAGCPLTQVAVFIDGETRAYYDSAGHPLASVKLADGDAQRVKIRLDARSVMVTGGGCHPSVSF